MEFAGNIKFRSQGEGELQNAVIERLSGGVDGATLPEGIIGRIVFNLDDNRFYYHDGLLWIPIATGGDASALQQEVDNIETASGGIFDEDGLFNNTIWDGFNIVVGPSSLFEVLAQIDLAFSTGTTLYLLGDVNISNGGTPSEISFLRWNTGLSPASWEDHILVLADVTDVTASVTEVNFISGVTSAVQDQFDSLRVFVGMSGTPDDLPVYTSANLVSQGAPLETAIGELDAAITTSSGILATNGATLFHRTLTAPAAGIQVLNPTGATGDMTLVLANDLASVENLATYGIAARTGDDTWTTRAVTSTGNTLTITNGTGVGGNINVDLPAITQAASGSFVKVSLDSYGRVNGNTAVTAPDITALVDSTYVNVTGDAMASGANLLFVDGGEVQGLPTTPLTATSATSKAYVDGVIAGLQWLPPIDTTSVIADDITDPTTIDDPVKGVSYILPSDATASSAGTGANQYGTPTGADFSTYAGWLVTYWGNEISSSPGTQIGSTGWATSYDIFSQIAQHDARFGVAHEYAVATTPTGTFANHQGAIFVVPSGTNLTGSPLNYPAASTDGGAFANLITSFGSPGIGSPPISQQTVFEIFVPVEGNSYFVHNPLSYHFGESKTFSGTYSEGTHGTDGDNYWVQFAGPGSVSAGTGLSYDGVILNVNLGAGITALPTNEVGIDIKADKAIQLTTTLTGGQLTFLIDGTTLTQSAIGLKVASQGITETELHTSVAGAGLTGGNGTPLSVDIRAGSGLELIGSPLDGAQLDLVDIPNSALANSAITISDGVTPDAVNLGETITFAGDANLTPTVTGNTVTYTWAALLQDLDDIPPIGNIGQLLAVASGSPPMFEFVNPASAVVSLNDLTDVDTSGANTNDVLYYNGASWEDRALSLITATSVNINDLADVDTTGVSDTYILQYSSGTWEAVPLVAGGASTDALTDVSGPPTNPGDILVVAAGSPLTYTPTPIQYIHTETGSPLSATWTVTHNLGQKYCSVTIVNTSDEVIIPLSITFNSSTQLTVTFNEAVAGKAIVFGVPGIV